MGIFHCMVLDVILLIGLSLWEAQVLLLLIRDVAADVLSLKVFNYTLRKLD